MTTTSEVKCACESCHCTVSTDSAVEKDDKLFCSEACANGHIDGIGCGHPGCECHSHS